MQRAEADGTSCVLLKTIAVCTIESTSQFFVPLLHHPVGVGQCGFFFSRSRWMGVKTWRVLSSARMPLLVPGVPCTMSGCVYPCGHRGVHRDAPNRVMQAAHPPMPCDLPCLVARPCLY